MLQTKILGTKKSLCLTSLTNKLQSSPSFSPSIIFVEQIHRKREESITFHLQGMVKKPATEGTTKGL